MPSSKQKRTSGPDPSQFIFALVAIGVTIALLASPVANAVLSARRAAAAVNLGQIAKVYAAYVQANAPSHMLIAQPGQTAHAAAITMAHASQINDAIIWFVKSDPKLNGEAIPPGIFSGETKSSSINPDFTDKTLSYDIAANMNLAPPPPIPQANPYYTPVAWTRGLRDDGTWAPDSPWQGAGGHIAFLDGHVVWLNRLSTQPGSESLFKYGTTTGNGTPIPTTNIQEALPPGSVILSAEPGAVNP